MTVSFHLGWPRNCAVHTDLLDMSVITSKHGVRLDVWNYDDGQFKQPEKQIAYIFFCCALSLCVPTPFIGHIIVIKGGFLCMVDRLP